MERIEYIDLMDLKILTILIQKPKPIMEITKLIGLAHANTLKRLKKLEVMQLLNKTKGNKTNQSIIEVTKKGIALYSVYIGEVESYKLGSKGESISFKIKIPKEIKLKGKILV